MTPPTRPSIIRKNGTLTGMTITIADCIAAAIANAGCGERKRATISEAVSVMPNCHHPMPATNTISSATRIPTTIPITVSSTRRGRASLTRPRLETVTVAASRGAA